MQNRSHRHLVSGSPQAVQRYAISLLGSADFLYYSAASTLRQDDASPAREGNPGPLEAFRKQRPYLFGDMLS